MARLNFNGLVKLQAADGSQSAVGQGWQVSVQATGTAVPGGGPETESDIPTDGSGNYFGNYLDFVFGNYTLKATQVKDTTNAPYTILQDGSVSDTFTMNNSSKQLNTVVVKAPQGQGGGGGDG